MSVLAGRLVAWWCVWDAWRKAVARRALEARGRELAARMLADLPPEFRHFGEPYAGAFGYMAAWCEREAWSFELPA